MTACRTLADVLAAADADSEGEPPMSQETVNRVAAILHSTCSPERAA